MVIHWSLSNSKSPQVSRTLLSILIDLSNSVIWTVSSSPLIFKSLSSFIDLSRIVPSVPIYWYHLRFVSLLLQLSCKNQIFISVFTLFQFYSVVCWNCEIQCSAGSLFRWLSGGIPACAYTMYHLHYTKRITSPLRRIQ